VTAASLCNLDPAAGADGARREPVAENVQASAPWASPASVERSWSQSLPPTPSRQNCCCRLAARCGAARLHLILLLSAEFWCVLEQHTFLPSLSEALGVWDFLLCLCNDLCDSVAFLVERHHRFPRLLEAEDFCGQSFMFT